MPQLSFINNSTPLGRVGVGLSSIIGPTGPQGAFGGPQGNIGAQGPTGEGFTSITNASNNRILTAINSDSANAESNLTFDGSFLQLNGGSNFTNFISLGSSQTGTISFNSNSNTGIAFSSNLVPSTANLELGSLTNPWKSIYISTGTVFIGPTGTLIINNNGLISSEQGFAAPYYQVGNINPGQGIILYENNNLLYFSNSLGETGAISVFNISPNSLVDTYYSLPGNIGFGITGPQNKIDVLGDIKATNTISATNFTGTNITTNNISFNDNGKIYFKTGSSTGCFIDSLRYNVTDSNHYVYYNNSTKELTQASPNYFYSYSTGTQPIHTGSNSSTSFFQPVTFNVNNILYHNFEHTLGSSVFTGTFASPTLLQFTYSLQIHSSSNSKQTAAAVLYLDNSPATGSYRSCTIVDTSGEYCLTNTFLVQVSSGRHAIQLQAAATNTNVSIGGIPNIFPPSNTYTSANLCCTRVI